MALVVAMAAILWPSADMAIGALAVATIGATSIGAWWQAAGYGTHSRAHSAGRQHCRLVVEDDG